MMNHAAAILFACVLLLAGGCSGDPAVKPAKLRHLNVKMLGAPVDDSLDPLLPAADGSIEPLRTLPEPDKVTRRYVHFELLYPKKVGFEPARASLNQLYSEYEVPTPSRERMALWKNRDGQYTIKLTEEDDGIKVRYDFIGPREPR